MHQITSKFELHINDSAPIDVCRAAVKYRAASIVLNNSGLIPSMLQHSMTTNGRYKIIMEIDSPDGANYGFANKFKGYGAETFGASGFDIMISQRNEVETLNEIRSLLDQLKSINSFLEIRFNIGVLSRSEDATRRILKAIKNDPPNMICLDPHLHMNEEFISDESIQAAIDLIREYTPVPLKLGTNLDLARVEKFMDQVAAFSVDLKTAQSIVHEIEARQSLERDSLPNVQ